MLLANFKIGPLEVVFNLEETVPFGAFFQYLKLPYGERQLVLGRLEVFVSNPKRVEEAYRSRKQEYSTWPNFHEKTGLP